MINRDLALPETNQDGLAAIDRAVAFTIITNDDYMSADAFCIGLKTLEKQVDDMFDDPIAKAFATHRSLTTRKNNYAEPLKRSLKIIKGKMATYSEEQEKMRREEEERLRAEAQKKAEDEAIARAKEAQDSGNKEEANEIINQPLIVAPIVLQKTVPKASTTIRKVKKYRITNANLVPREYLMLDNSKVGGVIRALGFAANIPGIEVYEEAA